MYGLHQSKSNHYAVDQPTNTPPESCDCGFTKAIVDAESDETLGFHIIGPHAAILVQEVVNAMAAEGNIASLAVGMHVHPALPELVLRTLNNLHTRE